MADDEHIDELIEEMNDEPSEEDGEDEDEQEDEESPEAPAPVQGSDDVEIFRGDLMPPFRKGKKPPYRALTPPERDLLFSFYEKWNGNKLAISRDGECRWKSYSQIKYYASIYHFAERYTHIKTEKAKETLASLADGKLEAISRALEMLRPRQVVVRNKDGVPYEHEGSPVFETVYPDQKTLKTAWEIVKTELGEPTWIAKSEVQTPLSREVEKALDLISLLTAHAGKPRDNADAVQGEPEAARDTAEVSAAISDDPHPQPSAQ